MLKRIFSKLPIKRQKPDHGKVVLRENKAQKDQKRIISG